MRYFLAKWSLAAGLLPVVLAPCAFAQGDLLSTLRVQVESKAHMKVGAQVHARTLDDFFAHDALLVPRGTEVLGTVSRVTPVTRRARLNAMSHGDFTPLHTPEIRFQQMTLRDGRTVNIDAETATQASETVRFYARGTSRPSMIKQVWSTLIGRKNAAVRAVTAPGKTDRIEDYFYAQLPWHPQEVEEGTVYELHLRQPLALDAAQVETTAAAKGVKQHAELKARLVTPLDSAKVKSGDTVEAVVTSPELDENHQVEIPQGSLLFGRVVHAKAARRFGRSGALRFTFERLQLPEGFQQQVNGVTTGIDSAHGRELAIDTEGGVEAPSNKSVIAPLALGLLAASALTEDEAQMGHAGVSANGFGLIARAVAIGTKSNVFGGVLGGVATARLVYTRFLAHGKDVKFDRGTAIDVDLGTSHLPMAKPEETK